MFKRFLLVSGLLSIIIGFSISSVQVIALGVDHGDTNSHLEYDLPSIYADDQPMVDNKVSIRTTFNYHGFVVVYEKLASGELGNITGMTMFMPPAGGGHAHTLNMLSDMPMSIPKEGATLFAHVSLPDSATGKDFRAVLYNDTDMDGTFNETLDQIVVNSDGSEMFSDFTVTTSFPTIIEVDNQTITTDNPIVTIKRSVLPGPGWQLLHTYDNGKLGIKASSLTSISHGENFNVKVDMTEKLSEIDYQPGVPFKIFAHMHYDVWETGEFNGTTDTHVYSPAFNDPILGNDSAVVFYLTINESQSSDLVLVGSIVGVLAIGFAVLIILRKKALQKD